LELTLGINFKIETLAEQEGVNSKREKIKA
jgi:hypothetical protein